MAKAEKNLCESCSHYRETTFADNKVLRSCSADYSADGPVVLKSQVIKCTSYDLKNALSIRVMEGIAYLLEKEKGKVGFKKPKDKQEGWE